MANRVSLRKGIGYISTDNVEGEHVGDPNRMDKDCLISFDMSFVVYATHKNLPKLSPDRSKINLHVDIAPYEGIDAYWRDSNLVLHKSINLVDTVRADAKLTTLESCILEAMYIVLEYGEHKNWGDPYSVTYSYNSTRSESYSKRVNENAEWDRDEVYNIIMNYEHLYNLAVSLARGSSPKKAIRDLSRLAKDVGLDNTPKIRLSDKGALLVAARIMEDYAN